MKLTKLTPESAVALSIETLRLDSEAVDLTSMEGIAASLRRAASFMCPTVPGRLVDAVLGAVRPVSSGPLCRDEVSDTLDLLVAGGDLLDLRREHGSSARLLYLAPPSYIERMPGTYFLLGIRPFGEAFIDGDLGAEIDYDRHTRTLSLDSSKATGRLDALGIQSISAKRWLGRPRSETAADFVRSYRTRLDVAHDAGEIQELMILDPATSVRFYKGRWRAPVPSDSGDFVGRRPQAYGADMWCLIRFKGGAAQSLFELPVENRNGLGRDEAWRYQAANDALLGSPQSFRVRGGAIHETDAFFDFFSPLPGFVERYLQFVGHPIGRTKGALFSYRIPQAVTREVADFLAEMLWMTQEETRIAH